MLPAMVKPRALSVPFSVAPLEGLPRRFGRGNLVVMDAVAGAGAGTVVEEGSRRSDGIQRLTIVQPDDWHLHLRDGDGLAAVAPLR